MHKGIAFASNVILEKAAPRLIGAGIATPCCGNDDWATEHPGAEAVLLQDGKPVGAISLENAAKVAESIRLHVPDSEPPKRPEDRFMSDDCKGSLLRDDGIIWPPPPLPSPPPPSGINIWPPPPLPSPPPPSGIEFEREYRRGLEYQAM